jgi:hypothetical protein
MAETTQTGTSNAKLDALAEMTPKLEALAEMTPKLEALAEMTPKLEALAEMTPKLEALAPVLEAMAPEISAEPATPAHFEDLITKLGPSLRG